MCCKRLAPMRFFPFSYFCTCCHVSPRASLSCSRLIPSMIRRIRIRLPTCLSTGLGSLLPIACFRIQLCWWRGLRLGLSKCREVISLLNHEERVPPHDGVGERGG